MLVSLLVLAAACTLPPLERGLVHACLEGPSGRVSDTDLALSATVGAAPAGATDCDASAMVSLVDDEGDAWVLGLTVTDADDRDVTPDLPVGEGDEVTLRFVDRLVWGNVAGFVLEDFEGALLAAADEGWWDGALAAGDVAGLVVSRGDEVVARQSGTCQPLEGYEIVFSADEETRLTPVDAATVHLGGLPLTALAVAAFDYGESRTCSIADATGAVAWIVYR